MMYKTYYLYKLCFCRFVVRGVMTPRSGLLLLRVTASYNFICIGVTR